MKKFVDYKNNRLVFLQENATPEFWDKQWHDEKLKKYVKSFTKERFIIPTTQKYLERGALILEGGCGKGQFVYALQENGYKAYGVDFAKSTITKLQELFPTIPFQYGDVRALPYNDDFFDGYWSLGVIEHFPGGYETILSEISRVLRPGGYLFLTFPHMSLLRRWKVGRQKYPDIIHIENWKDSFYQFALDEERVKNHLKKYGLEVVKKVPFEGLKGLKDEVSGFTKAILTFFYANENTLVKVLRHFLTRLLAPFSSHAILLVVRKKA